MPKFSQRSRDNLKGVHPDLVRVLEHAILGFDFTVICGVRTDAEQKALYAQGRTKPGPKVTWTLNSRHKINKKTGFGHAVDVVPYPLDWNDTLAFDRMAAAILSAAKAEGVRLTWGADWDRDNKPREKGESDSPHFELFQ
jgi:peptidoglycan LD-endopeptidase CwlK